MHRPFVHLPSSVVLRPASDFRHLTSGPLPSSIVLRPASACPVKFFEEDERSEFNWGPLLSDPNFP